MSPRHLGPSVLVAAVWLGAFSLSYDHARQQTGPDSWSGYVWPLVLDVAVMAGTAVLMAARRSTDKRAWLALLGLGLLLPGLALSGWANYLAGTSALVTVASCALPWFVLVGAEVLSVLHRTEQAKQADPAAVALAVTLTRTENATLTELARRLDALAEGLDLVADRLTAQAARVAFVTAEMGVRLTLPTREQLTAELTEQARKQVTEHLTEQDAGPDRPTTPSMFGQVTEPVTGQARKQPRKQARKQVTEQAGMTDEQAIATIRQLDADHGSPVGRPRIMAATGAGSTRAARLATEARRTELHAVNGG